MKKNWFMRIAGVMLALAMITSCFVGSTFAKYVTKAEGADNARVAKFGVLLGMSSDGIFKTEYETHEEAPNPEHPYGGEYSVVSSGAYTLQDVDYDKVVAPGTSNEFVATVYGTPEVAVRYQLVIDDLTDIVLPAGTYTDYTELVPKPEKDDNGEYVIPDDYNPDLDYDNLPEMGYYKVFTLDKDYAPIMWDIVVENSIGTKMGLMEYALQFLGDSNLFTVNGDGTITYTIDGEDYTFNFKGFSADGATGIVRQYANLLELLLPTLVVGSSNAQIDIDDDGVITISMDFDPNTEMDYKFSLTWAWNFEGNLIVINGGHSVAPSAFLADTVDKADTFLGNYMAYLMGDDIDVQVPNGDGTFTTVTMWTAEQMAEFDALNPDIITIKAHFTATATQID